ncbi:MAG TPA: DPP IV N-terminal domain-containing protein [Trebonia sp.]|nr:DPP IV N-terminal domain-containing protein [Trebonia sp.]
MAYVADGALHVTELVGGAGHLLAAPEHDDISYGLAEHAAAESMHRFHGYWWAPDGRRLLAARVDNAPVQRWWISDPANPERPPRAVRYPAAGTANADVTLHVLRLDGSKTEVTWDRGAYEYLATAEWDSRGPLLSVQSRDQRTVLVLAADAVTGQTTLLHAERDDAWVELAPGTPVRTSGGDLVIVSDRDGSRRLVVGGAAVTPDGLHVDSVSGTDGESVYFTATDERDPTKRHLWRYDPGQGLSRCSADPGVHDGEAAGGTVVVLSRTEVGSAAAVAWRDGTRAAIASLEAEPLLKPRVTWLTLGARALRSALLLPSWYRPGTRLPVLLSPYAGPAMQRVVRVRDAAFCEDQWFAEQGFAVLVTDGRGTPGRGPGWPTTTWWWRTRSGCQRRCSRPAARTRSCRCPAPPTRRPTPTPLASCSGTSSRSSPSRSASPGPTQALRWSSSRSVADALAQEERGPVEGLGRLVERAGDTGTLSSVPGALRSDLERRHLGLPAG